MYRRMHVLVEGRDDRAFFDAVIKPILEEQYDHVQIWEYAGATLERRKNYIRSILAMEADYLFVADINTSPCVTERKSNLVDRHEGAIAGDRTIVVVREIESWYAAGVDDEACRELGIACLPDTVHLTKEQFREMMPRRFHGSVVDFMAEILRRFREELARERNQSFRYLMDVLEQSKRGLNDEPR